MLQHDCTCDVTSLGRELHNKYTVAIFLQNYCAQQNYNITYVNYTVLILIHLLPLASIRVCILTSGVRGTLVFPWLTYGSVLSQAPGSRLQHLMKPSQAIKTKNAIVRHFWHICRVYFHFMIFYGILTSLS